MNSLKFPLVLLQSLYTSVHSSEMSFVSSQGSGAPWITADSTQLPEDGEQNGCFLSQSTRVYIWEAMYWPARARASNFRVDLGLGLAGVGISQEAYWRTNCCHSLPDFNLLAGAESRPCISNKFSGDIPAAGCGETLKLISSYTDSIRSWRTRSPKIPNPIHIYYITFNSLVQQQYTCYSSPALCLGCAFNNAFIQKGGLKFKSLLFFLFLAYIACIVTIMGSDNRSVFSTLGCFLFGVQSW